MAVATRANRLLRRVRVVAVVTAHAPMVPLKRGRKARGAAVAIALGFAVALGAQLLTGWMIHTDRAPLSDPQYSDKLRLLRAHPGFTPTETNHPTTLLFLGSSRTFDAVDAGAVASSLTRDFGQPVEAFNFAHAGAGPVTTAVYMRRLLAEGIKPNAVVVEVHPAFLTAQVSPPPEAQWLNPIRLRPNELDRVRELGLRVDTPAAHGPRGWLLPLSEYRVHLLDRYAPVLSTLRYRLGTGPETDRHGFVRIAEVPHTQRAKLLAATRAQYGECWSNYRPGGSGLKGLREVLETCRESGVRAALLITPESTAFRGWYGEPGRSLIAPVVGALANEFGVPFFDAREWLSDELISDGHHLTGSGADAFTERLVREAIGPWLRSPVAGGKP